jgi:hypothetical protein
MDFITRTCLLVAGVAVVLASLRSAVRTFVLPRSAYDQLSRWVFYWMRRLFDIFNARALTYEDRDRTMAFYAPVSLLILLGVWLALILTGYGLIYLALGIDSAAGAFMLSGSSLLTLGTSQPPTVQAAIVVFTEAALGLIMVALLIAYLPTMYAAFSQREIAVTMLEVRAGSPPSAIEMILRYNRIHGLDQLHAMWAQWERWFADLEESHTSLAALAFFRSPQPEHSWITAAGAILDAAALVNSLVGIAHDPQADLCLRAGYLALRRIADFFRIEYNPSPTRDDPISISRAEFDSACEQLAAAAVPINEDREKAWLDFKGWRVNYDTVLLALANLTLAPYALWSSDRSLIRLHPHGGAKKK